MNALAKVLVVLVLVLSVGFAASQVVLYGQREDYGRKFIDERKLANDLQQRLTNAQADLADTRRTADETKETLESQLLAAKTALEDENAHAADLQSQVVQLTASVQSLSDGNQKLDAALANRDNAIQELRTTVADRDQSIRQDLDKIGGLQKTVADRDGTIGTLQQDLTETRKTYKVVAESEARLKAIVAELVERGVQVPPVPLPVIDGRVVSVDAEHGVAVVNKGEGAGVKPNTQFTVYNDGGYVSRLVINNVQPDVSLGRIIVLAEGKQVKPGDLVTTRIP